MYRTNNRAEAYNNVIGSKVRMHPNPYTLISVIKDELGKSLNFKGRVHFFQFCIDEREGA